MNRAFLTSILISIAIGLQFCTAEQISITIYNQNLGLVRETREFNFEKGLSEIRFTDVASKIIPTSVHFKSENAFVLEQNFEYDLVNVDGLLQKYIDSEIEVLTQSDDLYRGILLAVDGDIVLKRSDGVIEIVKRGWIADVKLVKLPENLITRPTLVWQVSSKKKHTGEGEVSYLTRGIGWDAKYVAVIGEDDETLTLSGWANIDNKSGATFKDAQIKLIAGDVQIGKSPKSGSRFLTSMAMSESESMFKEQSFYEYHLYTLQRKSTLKNNQIKQISLFDLAEVKEVKKEYRTSGSGKVEVTLEFMNSENYGLGFPLPKGLIRMYKKGPDNLMEFIGEDNIDHTPKNEKIRIRTGNAFDVISSSKRLEQKDTGNLRFEEYQIKIRNHKDEKIEVIVPRGFIRYNKWKILTSSHDWEKKSAYHVEWIIEVDPEGETVLNFSIEWEIK